MTLLKALTAGLLVIAALTASAFLALGPARIWSYFGPADLGPVAFETLQRRASPNDALACPKEFCTAKSDVIPPVFAASAKDLRAAFAKVIVAEPQLERVDANDQSLTDRYVQRTKLMQYPDTIVVRFIDRPNGASTIALYSRSQLGESDLGVNLARIKRWLDKLATEVPVAK